MPRVDRHGVALLEVLVALTVLGIVSAATTVLAIEAGRVTELARASERDVRRASAYMDIVALWPTADLERRLGRRRQGEWMLEIQRTDTTLYDIAMHDSLGRRTLLRTSLYRPDTVDTPGAYAPR